MSSRWANTTNVRMQAKHIPDVEILAFIRERGNDPMTPGGWVSRNRPRWVFCWDFECYPWRHFPWKVVVAKLRQLQKRKLIDACLCGCRMDIEMTPTRATPTWTSCSSRWG